MLHPLWQRRDAKTNQVCILLQEDFLVKKIKICTWREFSGNPVVRTQHFHCWARVQSLVKEFRFHKPGVTRKKRKSLSLVEMTDDKEEKKLQEIPWQSSG